MHNVRVPQESGHPFALAIHTHLPLTSMQLLDLGDELLEAILLHLEQEELRRIVPVVCRRLCDLLQRSTRLWSSFRLTLRRSELAACRGRTAPLGCAGPLPTHCAAHSSPCHCHCILCRPIPSRHGAHVVLDGSAPACNSEAVYQDLRGRLGRDSRHRRLPAESLTEVKFDAEDFQDDSASGILHMLAPLEKVPHLSELTVYLSDDFPVLTAAQMHLLPRLGRLRQLQDLVWRLASECVPPEFARLTSLTRLELALYWSPATAGSLQQLSSLTGLQALQLMYMWGLPAGQAPPGGSPLDFLTPAFSRLDNLALRGAGLDALPPAVTALRQLTDLDLSYSQFSVPGCLEGLQQLSNLRWLILQAAGLEALPPAVTALRQLTHLDLSSNLLLAPGCLEGLQQLSNLRWLSLCACSLARLPPQLAALSALGDLRMANNGALQVTAAELRGMLEHMPGLTRLSLDKHTAQRITAVEWVQLSAPA